ncbi:MAG: hypothetical protein PHU42_02295 [Patescibacteria group bacterium]|nr:hypothetical protein [Patescibacteria group bacterium]
MEILVSGPYELENTMRKWLNVLQEKGFEVFRRADGERGGLNFLARKEGENQTVSELLGTEIMKEAEENGATISVEK